MLVDRIFLIQVDLKELVVLIAFEVLVTIPSPSTLLTFHLC